MAVVVDTLVGLKLLLNIANILGLKMMEVAAIVTILNPKISQREEGLDPDQIQKNTNHLNLIKVQKVPERDLRVILEIDIFIMKEVIIKKINITKMVLDCHSKVISLAIILQEASVQIWVSMVIKRDNKRKMKN